MPSLKTRCCFAAMLAVTAAWLVAVPPARAQYFGRNKVQYRSFDFQVLRSAHFDVYYYPEERLAAADAARLAERWYTRWSSVFDHELSGRQPLILYASHPQFEQTNAISGDLEEGTGGETDILKRRIVLPMAGPMAENDHVIGHELVHAFQFDITGNTHGGPLITPPGATRLPLWFVEGMAEYLSLGPVDPNTTMWMRDAAESDNLPSIHKLDSPRYFPYRYGQALWAFIAGRYGSDKIARLLREASRLGDAERAFEPVLGVSSDSLSKLWHRSLKDWEKPILAVTTKPDSLARPLLVSHQGSKGRLNVAPSLSPDGSRLMFISERDQFSIEVFLADAKNGEVLRSITKTAVDPHYQSLEFINSAGAWSPDGKRFALAAVSSGEPLLAVIDAEKGSTEREYPLKGLDEVLNPTWSPDGKKVALSARSGGYTDLYLLDLESGECKRLTSDRYAEIEPAWSPDGKSLAYVTDRFTTQLDSLAGGTYDLALYDLDTGLSRPLPDFAGARNIDPQWSPDGKSLYFIADPEGISNVYRLDLDTGQRTQLTNLFTGVSGITSLSPALSVARQSGDLVFSVYAEGGYSLYTLDPAKAAGAGVDSAAGLDTLHAAELPPEQRSNDRVDALRDNYTAGLQDPSRFKSSGYHAGLSLDYIDQPSVGIGVGIGTGSGGAAVGGGAGLYWSDMLGDRQLATIFQLAAQEGNFFNNIAALVAYQNLRNRWNWGIEAGQIPTLTRGYLLADSSYNGEPAVLEQDYREWEIDRLFLGTVSYPFSRVQRIELGAGVENVTFASEVESRYFSQITGDLLSDNTQSIPTADAINLFTTSAALVYDTSIFGGTSPLKGQSYRLEVRPAWGTLNYFTVLADYRRYQTLFRPFTLAGRVLHYGRYGRDADTTLFSPMFLGYSWLLRGYSDGSFTADEVNLPNSAYNRLFGSRIAVANLELRMPLLGAAGLLYSPQVPPVEAYAFFDAGDAWTGYEKASFLGGDLSPLTSYGAGMRVNIFGVAVGEVDLVHPNQRADKGWMWQFSLQPGF